MDIFTDLEKLLRTNPDFLQDKTQVLVDKLLDDPLFKDLFDLAELCNYFVKYVVKKQAKSSLDDSKFGEVFDGMGLWDFVDNQKDTQFYVKTLKALQSRFDILGKNVFQPVPRPVINQEEEKKNDGIFRDNDADDDILSEEDKNIIELYGPKIRVIRWYFENDIYV